MGANHAESGITVFAKDFPEIRMVVEVKIADLAPADLEAIVKRIARRMWGANCHYGLIFTPTVTYVLRDDFTIYSPEAIRVAAKVPTARLLARMGPSAIEVGSQREFERLVQDWLERLARFYDSALPDDAEISKIFFPEIVGAVDEGRVMGEASFR